MAETKVIKKTLVPTWDETFVLTVTSPMEKIYFEVHLPPSPPHSPPSL